MMMKKLYTVAATAVLLTAVGATAADVHTTPPAKFKKVSTLVKLPDFVPGLGVLYVDPATLPAGPFLGYDKQGKLLNVVYMIPLKDIDAHKAFNDLGTSVKGVKIDHTDFYFNPGHPGVEEPHYHITEWVVSKDQQEKAMK